MARKPVEPAKKQGRMKRSAAEATAGADRVQKYFGKIRGFLKSKLPVTREGRRVRFEFEGKPIETSAEASYSGYPKPFRFVNAFVNPKNSRLVIVREMYEESSPGYHRAVFVANTWERSQEIALGHMDRRFKTEGKDKGILPHGGVYVRPQYRREGIGTILDYFSRKHLVSKGITEFEVVVEHTPEAPYFAEFSGKRIKKKLSF